ncbi:Nicastrin [Necator americanus]|uniref:Nicastrin n=1 Tax=Necator americanus TaxID=51031 RepID=W2TXC5_NECAM|nr:Nicastrin [Necator americanus]ETN85682.1 Nicastrin [Necator americanus]
MSEAKSMILGFESDYNGVVVFLKEDELKQLRDCWRERFKDYFGKYHVVLSTNSINRVVVDSILESSCIAGLIVIDSESELDPTERFSHDGACPNPNSDTYNDGCSSATAWNDHGYILFEGLRNIDWKMQILYVYNDSSIEIIKKVYNASSKLPDNSYLILSARMDSFGLIPEISPGDISAITSVIAVLAVARAIGSHAEAFEEAAIISNKYILIALFDGESFENIGSSDAAYSMTIEAFPRKLKSVSVPQLDLIGIPQLDAIIEVQQLGTGDGSTLNILADGEQFQSDKLKNMLDSLSRGAEAVGGSLNYPTASSRMPPSSWHSFARFSRSIKGVVLAPFSNKYECRRINSMLDRVNWTAEQRSAAISEITLAASSLLYAAADHVRLNSSANISLEIDRDFVSVLVECFIDSPNWIECDFFKKMDLSQHIRPGMWDLCLSLELVERVSPRRQTLLQLLLHSSRLDPIWKNVYYYIWQVDPNSGIRHCYRTPVSLFEVVSPAFQIKGYNFTNNTFSTWTESHYRIENLRLYLVIDTSFEYIMFGIGIAFLIVSFLIVGRCNDDTFMIKAREHSSEGE